MHENSDSLISVLVILITATLVLFVSGKLRVPSVLGFLFTGVLLGPNGILEIENSDIITAVSELGIILMLFTIGLEFSFDDLIKRKKVTLIGGTLQIGVTGIIFAGLMLAFNLSVREAVFFSMLLSLSSTAVVLKLFSDKQMIDTIVGKNSLSLLIFQDIMAVLFIVFLPLFNAERAESVSILNLSLGIASGIGILFGIFFVARYVIPYVLYHILRTRNRELFLITIILIIAGINIICLELGLSAGLGAFLAGLVIADSDYSNYTLSHIIPFQDLFTSLFFISVGFLFDPVFVFYNLGTIVSILIVVLAIKALVIFPICLFLGISSAASLVIAMSLSQVGEFSFILASLGNQINLFEKDQYSIFIAVTLISMAITPALIFIGGKVTETPLFKKFSRHIDTRQSGEKTTLKYDLSEHLLIIGFGITGKLHVQICKKLNIPYVVVEMNPLTVRHEKKNGTNITHGNASSLHLLKHINVHSAKVAIVGVPNYEETLRIIKLLKSINPNLFVIARCRQIFEMEALFKSGADKVVAVELESALEMLALMMGRYFVAGNEINQNLEDIRGGFYRSNRGALDKIIKLSEVHSFFDEAETQIFKIPKTSPLIGKSLHNSEMRLVFHLSLLAYKRGDDIFPNPEPDYLFAAGDYIMLFGNHEDLIKFSQAYQLG